MRRSTKHGLVTLPWSSATERTAVRFERSQMTENETPSEAQPDAFDDEQLMSLVRQGKQP